MKVPVVMVPVLSNAIAFTRLIASIALPPLNKIPCREPAPMPEKNANGTDNTKAHGQDTTRNVKAV